MTKLLPFERTVLDTVGTALPDDYRARFAEQVAQINKVQRLLEWNEVEFYSMRWFRVHWPREVLFREREELQLACGRLLAPGMAASIKVWAVGGHVFSLESDSSLKPFQNATEVSFVLTAAALSMAPGNGLRWSPS